MFKFNDMRIKIVATTSIVLFSCIACFTGVYAWFQLKFDVNGAADEFEINDTNDVIVDNKYQIYGFDFEHNIGSLCDDMVLHGYDCFIEEKNIYNKKYLKLNLSFPNDVIEGSFLKITIDAPINNFRDEIEKDKIGKHISNVVQFRYFDNSNHEIDTTASADKIYEACQKTFADIVSYDCFVVDKNLGKKEIIINQDINLPAIKKGEGYKKELIFEIDYNLELIEFFRENYNISKDIGSFKALYEIQFDSDVKEISFDIVRPK